MPQVQTAGFQSFSPLQIAGPSHGNRGALQRTLHDRVAEALGVETKGHGVHGLAVAIRDKLASAPDGTDAVPSVLETINRALDDAAQKLAAQGASQDQIDAGIARFKAKLARELDQLAGGPAQPEQPSTSPPPATTPAPAPGTSVSTEKSAIAAREVVRQGVSLNILTAEGDKISIKFRSLNVTEVAAAKVSNGSDSTTAVQANVISRGRFQVEVDGNLNEAERSAIGDLLDKVDGIASDFLGGDVQAAFTAAARVGLDNAALSAFDLKLSYSRTLSAVQTYASNAALGDKPAAPGAKPESKPVEPVKLPAATQTPVAATPDTAAPATDATKPVTETPAADVPSVVDTTSNQPARAAIGGFVKDVLAMLSSVAPPEGDSSLKFTMRWKMEFLMGALTSAAKTPDEKAATNVLGSALDNQVPASSAA